MDKKRLAIVAAAVAIAAGYNVYAANEPLTLQKTTATSGTVCGLPVTDVTVNRAGENMNVGMNFNLKEFEMKGDRAAVFMPVLINGNDSITFDPVGLYSNIRWMQYIRRDEQGITGPNETSIKYKNRPEVMEYSQCVPYAEWMNGAELKINRTDYGCCSKVIDECESPLTAWSELSYLPKFHFVEVTAEEEKNRELAGKAYIDFPVNMTDLYPDYRKNPVELAKIIATIDSVRNDKDVTVKRITIKGWASPESPWSNNKRLAMGRTATLKRYVMNLYNFPDDFIETDYYPEDWFGLRDFVETSNLPHKNEILALIDDDSLEPDPKEDKLKKTYPDEYKFLLATVYPGLRHSDYKIEYTIRSFTDINEIAAIFASEPSKLSINEMIMLANSLEPGSEEYNNVYETAALLYPTSDVANLNAANAVMQRGDMVTAERYLNKAGDSDAAVYSRGVFAALKGDYHGALQQFKKVSGTIPEAAEASEILSEILK